MSRYLPALFASVLLLMGCKTKPTTDDFNYLQNAEQIAAETSAASVKSVLQPGDQLAIMVAAKNMEVVKPFNQGYYSSQNAMTPSAPSTSTAAEKIYTVDSSGEIDFPVLGRIAVGGRTLEQLKDDLSQRISVYVKDPTVTVRHINFKVTVLGEVVKPGQYTLTDVNPTLLNALGLAGDLTMYGERNNILVVRNENGTLIKERLNLKDASFFSSPFYKLKQGDVIYVSANDTKQKTSRLDPNTSIYIAVAGTVIGLAGIFITIFKK